MPQDNPNAIAPNMSVGGLPSAPPAPAPQGPIPIPANMSVGMPTPPRQGATGLAGVASGFGGGMFETAQGLKNLVNKALPATMQIPDIPPAYRENITPTEQLGGLTETIAEWAGGEEVLKGLSKLATIPGPLLKLAKENQFMTKLLVESAKGATIGGAQGAVKGAAEGRTGKEAEMGAIGGAIAGPLGERIGAGAAYLGRVFFGIGMGAEEAMMRAGRPYMTENVPIPKPGQSATQAWMELTTKYKQAFQVAKDRILDAAKDTKIEKVNDFVEVLYNAMRNIRQNEFGPLVARIPNQMVDLFPVWAKVRAQITPQLAMYDTEGAKKMMDFAMNFMRHDTVTQVARDLEYFNAQLKNFYKMDLSAQAAMVKTDPIISTYETVAEGLRDQLYSKLNTALRPGDRPPAILQKEYGALKDLMRVFGKRATTHERQNLLNLAEVRGFTTAAATAVGAFATGHNIYALGAIPIAAVPMISKYMTSPEAMLNIALRDVAGRPSLITRIVKPAIEKASAVAGALGAGALREMTTPNE